ncbi:MAG: endonuclease III [Victivallaceae bacterium]
MTGKKSVLKRKELLSEVNSLLYQKYGRLHCKLNHRNAFELLVATILSAQCTDVRVNQVTAGLFKRFPDAASFASADHAAVEKMIEPAGLFRNKTKSIIAASRKLMDDYHGEVPADMDALTCLAGVGRKTANVVLGDAFGIPGFPVDTHVKRVLNRLGYADSEDPEKIESEVNSAIAPEYWVNLSHMLIMHGREICHARNPDCEHCLLSSLCGYYKNLKRS